MSSLMLVLIFLTVAFVVGLCVSIASGSYDGILSFILCLMLVVFFGWVLAGAIVDVKTNRIEIIPTSIVKSKTALIVEYKHLRNVFEDAGTYNSVNDSTKYELIETFNMYGFSNSNYILIKQ